MRRRIFVLAVLIAAMFPSFSMASSATQMDQQYPAKSSVMGGGGIDQLEIVGTPDEHQLVWSIREPRRDFENWTVVVYNASDQVVSDITATLEYQSGGTWYLANMQASKRSIIPPTINPGEVGFALMGNVLGSPPQWTDARVVVDSVSTGPSALAVSLDVDVSVSSGSVAYTGSFTNSSAHPVQDVRLFAACVEGGKITDIHRHFSDIIRLGPGEQDPFSFPEINGKCADAQKTIFGAMGDIIQ